MHELNRIYMHEIHRLIVE